jgi:quinohemoprotein ethanol dehydrogenase
MISIRRIFGFIRSLSVISIVTIMNSCSDPVPPAPGWIDQARLMQADQQPENWMSLGRDFKQQHFSPLQNINENNVKDLGFAWEYNAGSKIGRVERGLEATPIVVDGIMYTSGAWGVVYALDAKTGNEIWRYDPDVIASYNRKACCDVVNRGVQVWKGKVYVATLDGYMVCLNAADGKVLWRKDTFTDRTLAYTITGAPQIAKNVVVIGNSGGEFGVRGYITAYDLETGEQKWRFFTVPGDPKKGFEHPEMEMASKTWDPNSTWEAGGGGTVWGQYAYDPELNLLYVGTGNSSPYLIWFRSPNGGDNLFLSSILAINPDNGKLAWHYQTTPGEIWDYTATMNIILADLDIKGKPRKVLMQAPKNGFFYVLDRATGELLSAEKYSQANWASHIDMKTGRPVLTGQGWYKDTPKLVIPSLSGAHSWQPMSYSPLTKLVYIPEIVAPMIYRSQPDYTFKKGTFGTGLNYENVDPPFVLEARKYITNQPDTIYRNYLKAWDPVTQKEAWKVELDIPKANGGVLSTAGNLVLEGASTGYLRVYQATTGKLLKEIFTGTVIMAAPMTYMVDGEQYIAVMASLGGESLAFGYKGMITEKYQNKGRILAFKLNGGTTPLPPPYVEIKTPKPPDVKLDPAKIKKGIALFDLYCINCHSVSPTFSHYSQYPDLGKINESIHAAFKDILLKGALSPNGMSSFADVLSEDDVEALHQFLTGEQIKLWNKENTKKGPEKAAEK